MRINVRQATPADAPAVAEVLNSVIAEGRYTIFDRPFSEEQERSFIASLGERSALFVAEVGGRIVGVQSMDLFSDLAASMQHVATMGTWLHADFRGRGIGRRLAEESLRFARSQGYGKVVIQVLAENAAALAFYRSLGFQDIGVARRHVRLHGRLHDEIYLEMLL